MLRNLRPRSRRLYTILTLATVLAMLVSMIPGVIPGAKTPTASAHNLDSGFTYMYFDPPTQAFFDARIAGSPSGTPLLQNGDTVGLIIKVVPSDGTTTGVGGYVDFYVPNGVQVTDVAYLLPNGSSGYDKVPIKGQSPIAIGDGPIGTNCTPALSGLTLGPNIIGNSAKAVADTTGCHNGTIAGVYADTGIFYSTDPRTAYGSYSGGALKNNSGDTVGFRTSVATVPNLWDAQQLAAYGIAGSANLAFPGSPIVDPNGRGNAPWGNANAVAGPESGYKWEFDMGECGSPADPCDATEMKTASSKTGPWQRIQYPGSQISKDQPGLKSTVLGWSGTDGSKVGFPLASYGATGGTTPLPATTSQTDTTSPKTIRWAIGQLTYLKPEHVWVQFKVIDRNALATAQGNSCPIFYGDTFGGDAGGTDNGKDHVWRYYDPNGIQWNACLGSGKVASRPAVKVGDTFQYDVEVYNYGLIPLTNVVAKDTLPSGVAFVSAVPAQNLGPNPLQWNIGTIPVGGKFQATVTVKATGSGVLQNTLAITSNEGAQTVYEKTPSGAISILNQSKSVSPTSVMPGGTVTYTILVKNVGSGPTGNPTRVDEYLPTGFTYQSLVSVIVNGANVTGSTLVNQANLNKPIFTVPAAINAGQQLVLTFTAKAGQLPGTYCNSYSTYDNGVPITTGALACMNIGGNAVSDFIWRDWDGDGVQDPGEEGIAGIQVCANPGNICTTTDANGNYLISGLSDGTYSVTVTNPPAGYIPKYDLDGTGTPNTTSVSLSGNTLLSTVDFGYKPGGTASIGDKVFDDQNNDGLFNGTDVGISGVTVNLYEDTNGDGAIDPVQDLLIATTTTSGGGNYSFTGLDPTRSYIVTAVDGATSPVDTYFTNPYFSSTGGSKQTVSPADFTAQGGAVTDADFGYFGQIPSSIGDQVFIDANNNGTYDAGDQVLPFVTVNLYQDTNGNGVLDPGEPLLRTTETNATGSYLFDNLGPGKYIVDVDQTDPQLPAGYMATRDLIAVNLGSNDHRTDVDFPFVPLIGKQVSKTSAVAPATLAYTITAQYPGNDLLADVVVTDTVPAGTTYVGGSANAGGVYDSVSKVITWTLGTNTQGAPAFAGSAVGTTSFRAVQDTEIRVGNPTTNYGANTAIQVKVNDRSERRALLKFNVSSLAGQTVTNASLRFFVSNNGGANTRIDVYPLTRAWDSTGTNWTKATATTSWATAGGDYNAANLLGSFVPSINNTYYTVSGAAVNALVQNWINNPSTNFGVILVMTGEVDAVQIRSMEDTNAPSEKPELVVTTGAGTTTRNPMQDTWIDQGSPTTINAAANPLRLVNSGAEQRSLLQWDLGTVIPAGATILSAGVRLYFTSGNSNVKLNLYRPAKTWAEGSATWILAQTGNAWAMPGGDYTTSLGSFQAPASNNVYQSYTSDALAALVQGWVNGTISNQGVLVIPTASTTNQSATFVSSEGTALQQPELFITYKSDVINQTVQTKLPNGFTNGQDTFIDVDQPGNNYGTDTVFSVRTPSASAARAILHFDLSSLAGQTVSSVNLALTVNNASANSRVEVYPLTRSFTELQATWNIAATGTNWTTPGGDYDTSTLIGTFVPSATGVYNISGAALVNLVQSWINSGATNYGLILVLKGINDDAQIRTREQGAPDQPKLTVTTGSGTTNLISDKDTELRQSQSTNNFGGANAMATVRAADEIRGLVQWDLSAFQPDVTVTAATMTFNVAAVNAGLTVNVSRLTQGWAEGAGTNGADADWLRHHTGQTWSTPGGGDFASPPLGAFVPSALGPVNLSNASVVSLVQGWLDGSISNNGVILTGSSATASQQADFTSVGTVDNANSPKLNFIFNATSRETHTTVDRSLVSTGGTIRVSMELSTTQTINTVTPVLNVSGTNGATATCGSPIPTPPVNVVAGTPTTFTWNCTANANSNIGTLTFTGSATSPSGLNFAASASNSVLVAPLLTFQATVPSPSSLSVITNTAYLVGAGDLPPFTPSNTVATAIGASIGDRVWADLDGDGVQDAGEPGIPGVQVCATPAGGGASVCATTDALGNYRIYGLTDGVSYNVAETAATFPSGYAPTTPATLTVTATTAGTLTADFGLRPPGTASIGDTVWLDKNEDGIKDADESGLPNITVRLYIDQNNDGAIDGGDTLLQTTATDANGNYLFSGLHPDDYLVQVVTTSNVTTPNGVVTTLGAAMDPTTGTTNPRDVTITTAGQTITDADFGYNWGGSIGDRLWYDNDGDKIGPAGAPGGGDVSEPYVAVGGVLNLYYDTNANGEVDPGEPIVAVALADGVGYYLFDNLPPANYVVKAEEQQVPAPPSSANAGQIGVMVATTGTRHGVNLVAGQDYTGADFGFIEASVAEGHIFYDANGNGVLDVGETTLPNVTVTITPPAGVDLGAGPGNPISTTTDAGGEWSFIVPPGVYTVTYNTADPDIPAALTQPTTPVSFAVTQIAGQERSGLDFGRDNSGVIGDTVYIDANGNGVQDGGEPGLANVTLDLYLDADGNPATTNDQTYLGSDVTDALGKYEFVGLPDTTGSQQYVVKVATNMLPTDFMQTSDPDDATPPCTGGECDSQGLATLTAANSHLDNTVDFGYQYKPGGVAGATFTIAGFVWQDTSGEGTKNPGEPVIPGATVTVDCGPNGMFTTVSTANTFLSNWSVVGIPQGATCTIDVDESTLPSPAYVATTPATRTVTNIQADQSGQNFGYQQQFGSISGTDCLGGSNGVCGDQGEPTLAGAIITLTWAGPDGILGTADDVTPPPQTTLANGAYSFTNLQPGLYRIASTNPAGYASQTDRDGGNPDNISILSLAVGQNLTGQDFIEATPLLLMDKDTSTPTVVVGGQATYQIVVRNSGGSVATGVTISDTLPSGFTYASTTGAVVSNATRTSTVNPTAGATTPTWGNWDINASGAVTLTFIANVGAGVTPGQYDNTAFAKASNHALIDDVGTQAGDADTLPTDTPETDEDVTVQAAPPQLLMDKDTSTPTVVVGGQATYQIVVRNSGGSVATGVTISDTLPSGFTYASTTSAVVSNATRTSTVNPTAGATTPTWGNWDINASGAVTLTFIANVGAGVTPGQYDNTAFAKASNHALIDDVGTQAGDADTLPTDTPETDEDVTVVTLPVLLIDKDTTTPVVTAGGQATYQIVVRNSGGSVASGVAISDTLPSGFTYASTTSAVVNNATRPSVIDPAAGATTPTWSSWNINAGGAVTLTFVANVDAGVLAGQYDNTAFAKASNHALIDDVGTQAGDADTLPTDTPETDEDVTVSGSPVLLMDKDTSTPTVVAGGQATYTIVVRNSGTSTATGVTIIDTLPTGFTYASTTGAVVSNATRTSTLDPTVGATTPTWGNWDIDPNGQVTLTFVANVGVGVTAGQYDNTAYADASNHALIDDLGTQDSDADTLPTDTPETDEDVTVLAAPDLLIDKDTSTPSVVSGNQATYQIVVRNSGGSVATGVTISDTLPAGFTYASTTSAVVSNGSRASTSNPSFGSAAPTWGVWTLSPSGVITLTFVVDVGAGVTPGQYDNTAYTKANNHPLIDDDGLQAGDADTLPTDTPETDEDVTVTAPPGSIGDFIYFDANGNGTQQGGETVGINGVTITAVNQVTSQTYTTVSVNGVYLLSNLLPGTYSVSVPSSAPGLVRTSVSPVIVTLLSGENRTNVDFGYISPTGIALASFTAETGAGGVLLRWATMFEDDIDGFVVWRAAQANGVYTAVSGLIPSQDPTGASYEWFDASAEAGHSYWYKLQVQPDGSFFGPILTAPEGGFKNLFTPFILRRR